MRTRSIHHRLLLGLLICAGGASTAVAGTIEGRVELFPKPPQKVAQRYPSGSGASRGEIEPIPTIVFVKGPVAQLSTESMAGKYTIAQRDTLFLPSHLVVPVGSVVSFPNEDDEFHNVFSYSKARRFDLGRYRKGESKEVRFDKPGVVKIYCEIHPWMRAAVIVIENPLFTVVDHEGRFSIDEVPAGDHTLVVWNMDRGAEEVKVTVPGGGTVEIEIRLGAGVKAELTEVRLAYGAWKPVAEGSTAPAAESCCVASASAPNKP